MRAAKYEYVRFRVADDEHSSFEQFLEVFVELKKDKDRQLAGGDFRDANEWPALFPDVVKQRFAWPSSEERTQWMSERASVPIAIIETHATQGLSWDFFRMIESFESAEFSLDECVLTKENMGELRFTALAYPYGGIGCLVALVEAFGFRVVGAEDGTGYRKLPSVQTIR